MKGYYPVVISYDESEKLYYVNFPDLPFCYSDAETFEDALYNAWDVLNLMLCDYSEKHNGELPSRASKPGEIPEILELEENEILSWVWYDTERYKIILQAMKQKTA